jgi:hypothetical protein
MNAKLRQIFKAIHEDETCDEFQVNLEIFALVISESLPHPIEPIAASDDVISNNNDSVLFECFAADCSGLGFAESAGVHFECSVCQHSNCLSCKVGLLTSRAAFNDDIYYLFQRQFTIFKPVMNTSRISKTLKQQMLT